MSDKINEIAVESAESKSDVRIKEEKPDPKATAVEELSQALDKKLSLEDEEEYFVVIWEVSLSSYENKLSAEATGSVYVTDEAESENHVKQSIRNGLKCILMPLGFRLTNSLSCYTCKVSDFMTNLKPKSRAELGSVLISYLSNLDDKSIESTADVIRAKKWLKIVLERQREFSISATNGIPPGSPSDRAGTTPFLLLEGCRRYNF